jgi:16S rRNA (cytosine967-C5)-methyltransferase
MSKNAGTSSPRKPKSSSAESGARAIAARVLARVWQDRAWASPALDAELARHAQIDPRESRLATELVYGVLRTSRWLESQIAAHAKNDRWRRTPLVRAQLCIAVYSLSFLDRVPGFAAVDQAVTAIRAEAGPQVAGFANAVLRKLARQSGTGRAQLSAVAARSLPAWLRDALERALGEEEAAAFVTAGPLPPPIGLCLRAGEDRDHWIAELRAAAPGASIAAGGLSPRAIVLSGAGDHRRLPGAASAWFVQEEGAQLAALALGAAPGDSVLDACAGRGGKTLLLCDEVGPEGAVDAVDLHPHKIARLGASPAGALVRATYAVDWTKGSGDVHERYRGVLVDAPCTGVGTLRRRPEIAARLAASDVTRLSSLQLSIARRAAQQLEDGGRLVYAVCSVLREEAEEVIAALVEDGGDGLRLEPAPFAGEAARQLVGEAPALRLLPQHHGTDGYFVASLVARRS